MKKPVTGYRVEMVIATTGRYAAYTSPKRPFSFEIAQSYAAHLLDGPSVAGGLSRTLPERLRQ